MNKSFNLLFYVKKSKTQSNGTAPLYLRITIDGKITELSVKRYIQPDKWNNQAQKVNGSNEEAKTINAYLKTFELQVLEAQHNLLKDKEQITTETLKNKLIGVEEKPLTIIPIFKDHNQKLKALQGAEYSKGTITRYETALKHTLDFLKWKYNKTDIEIKAIDNAFINEFEFYLRSVRKCNNNSAVKYVKSNFGKVVRLCVANGWLQRDPFINYTSKMREVNRQFLTEQELHILSTKVLMNERLRQVRDIFVFSCYTGLAYIDAANLTPQNIGIGIDGERWIYTFRQKTDTRSNIPLLQPAFEIIEKYKEHKLCKVKNRLLPVLTNQKMNAYLKEIAAICNISKELTFHIARHTFATTVTLSNGIPIETVSKMLGHSSIKQTQHYAKILDRKVSDDMKILREKFTFQKANLLGVASI
jgi:site-specific recombinase XerD